MDTICPGVFLNMETWAEHQGFCWSDLGHQVRDTQGGDSIFMTGGSACVSVPDRVHRRRNPYRAHSCGRRCAIPKCLDHRPQTVDLRNHISCGRLLPGLFSSSNSWSVLGQVWRFGKLDWEISSVIVIAFVCKSCCNKAPQMRRL